MKSPTSILSPSLELNQRPTGNYCYIPDFGRYYWLDNLTYDRGIWTASLSIDVLATYKNQIGGAELYILRAANDFDTRIMDTHYPITSHVSVQVTSGSVWFGNVSTVSGGVFILGLRGRINADQTAGGITFLVMTPAQFKAFTEDLFNGQLNNYITGGTLDIGNSLAQMIFNPTQYIASCIWLPAAPSSETPANGFNVGWWGFTTGAKIVQSVDALIYTSSLALPAHPETEDRGIYVNAHPFTTRFVNLPRFGVVDLSNLPQNADTLNIELTVDPISGQGLYRLGYELIASDTNIIFDEIQCQIGVEMPLSSNQVTIQEAAASISSVASAVLDAAQFNGVGAAADIASALSVMQPHINDISGASGFLGYTNSAGTPFVVSRFAYLAKTDQTEEGRPLCAIRTPAALGGYMKALHGSIAINGATAQELNALRGFLEDGFFYE